jgi:hypothetical protein
LPGHIISRRPGVEKNGDPAFVLTEHGGGKCFDLAYTDGTRFVANEACDRVWGAFQPPLTSEDLATYFLGPVMGFLLRRRQITCLHASGVELQQHAVVFAGGAGYGKSTTAAALALRGVPVLSEDIVPLKLTEGRFWAIPGYPRVCLWPEAVANLTGDPESLPKLTPIWEKRYLPLDGIRAKFAAERKPLGIVYLFGESSGEGKSPRVEEMRPKEALLGLVQSTYMNWLPGRERRAREFDELSRLVKEVPVRKIVSYRDAAKIPALCDLIQADVGRVLAGR